MKFWSLFVTLPYHRHHCRWQRSTRSGNYSGPILTPRLARGALALKKLKSLVKFENNINDNDDDDDYDEARNVISSFGRLLFQKNNIYKRKKTSKKKKDMAFLFYNDYFPLCHRYELNDTNIPYLLSILTVFKHNYTLLPSHTHKQ